MYLLTLSSAAALAAEETGADNVGVSPPGADSASVADTTSCDHAALADVGVAGESSDVTGSVEEGSRRVGGDWAEEPDE